MKSDRSVKVVGIMFIVIAVVSLVFSFVCFSFGTGGWESNNTYGGDAYTGIQNAAAQSANNIYKLNENVKIIAGMAFFINSLLFVALGLGKLLKNGGNPAKTNNNPAQPFPGQMQPQIYPGNQFNSQNMYPNQQQNNNPQSMPNYYR